MQESNPIEKDQHKDSKIDSIKIRLGENIDEKERVELWLALAEETHITNTPYALEISNRAKGLSKELCYKKGQARSSQLVGVCNWMLSHNDEAMTALLESLWIFEEIEDRRGEAKSLYHIGNVLNTLYDFEQSIGYFFQSSRIFQLLKDKKGQGEILNSIGEVFINIGDYNEALTYLNKSTRLFREINDKRALAISLKNIGAICLQIKKYDESLAYLDRSIAYATDAMDVYTEAEALNYMGKAYELLVNNDTAREVYFKSLLKCQEAGFRRGEGTVLLSLGQLFLKENDINSAEQYLNEALLIAEMIKLKSVLCEANKCLAEIYEKKQEYKKALHYHKAFYSEKEKLVSKDISNKINVQKQSFEVNTVQKELDFYKGKYEEILKAFKELQTLNVSLQSELDLKTRLNAELSKQLSGGEKESRKDYLTDLYTMRAMDSRLKQMFGSVKNRKGEMTMAVIRIDYFRTINLQFSNKVANEVLKTVAKILKDNLRTEDTLVRYQSNKFALMFMNLKAPRAYEPCDKLRRAVETYRWGAISNGLKVTLSIGLSDDLSVATYSELLDIAEDKLKQSGTSSGNQVRY